MANSRKSETKFVPCVARHFTNKAVTYGKNLDAKLSDLHEGLEKYDGLQVPEIAEALREVREQLGPVQDAVLKLARLLDSRSSQPQGF